MFPLNSTASKLFFGLVYNQNSNLTIKFFRPIWGDGLSFKFLEIFFRLHFLLSDFLALVHSSRSADRNECQMTSTKSYFSKPNQFGLIYSIWGRFNWHINDANEYKPEDKNDLIAFYWTEPRTNWADSKNFIIQFLSEGKKKVHRKA